MSDLTDLEKLAVDSVVKRQQSLLDLMRNTDNRSQQFAIAYAGFTGAALLFVATNSGANFQNISIVAAALIILYALALLLGCALGFVACWYARIGLAARGPEFWTWALKPQHKSEVMAAFLKEAAGHLDENRELQARAARLLRYSMACGLTAVVTASIGSIGLVANRWLALW